MAPEAEPTAVPRIDSHARCFLVVERADRKPIAVYLDAVGFRRLSHRDSAVDFVTKVDGFCA